MTVIVTIDIDGAPSQPVTVNDPALEAIRFSFNPSGIQNVHKLKALAAAFLTACDDVLRDHPSAGREFAVAKTNMQTASMWAVLGATKGLP
jgi:hypothetical protein